MIAADKELKTKSDKIADLFIMKLHERLKDGPEAANAFEYWQACFSAAREHTEAAYLQTKAETALTELLPCLN